MLLRVARWLAIAALVIGYPVLAHYTSEPSADGKMGQLGALVALAPLLIIAVFIAWRSAQRVLMLGLIALCCLALYAVWPTLAQHFGVLYWLQHAGSQIILGVVFGRTLMAGQLPLCTRFARAVHAPNALSAEHEQYARNVTLAWTLFFAAMAAASTLLFFFTPLASWSIFANFLTPALVLLMFVVEYGLRYRLVPHMPRTHFLDAFRAYQKSAGPPDQIPRA